MRFMHKKGLEHCRGWLTENGDVLDSVAFGSIEDVLRILCLRVIRHLTGAQEQPGLVEGFEGVTVKVSNHKHEVMLRRIKAAVAHLENLHRLGEDTLKSLEALATNMKVINSRVEGALRDLRPIR